jgi:hypothetical protein
MSAGRDVITKENATHIETKTRHVEVKEGWSLFRLDNNATTSTGGLSGLSGIGLIGEVLLIILFISAFLMILKRCMMRREKRDTYRAFFRAQQDSVQPPRPMVTTEANLRYDDDRNQTPPRTQGRSNRRASTGSIASDRI